MKTKHQPTGSTTENKLINRKKPQIEIFFEVKAFLYPNCDSLYKLSSEVWTTFKRMARL